MATNKSTQSPEIEDEIVIVAKAFTRRPHESTTRLLLRIPDNTQERCTGWAMVPDNIPAGTPLKVSGTKYKNARWGWQYQIKHYEPVAAADRATLLVMASCVRAPAAAIERLASDKVYTLFSMREYGSQAFRKIVAGVLAFIHYENSMSVWPLTQEQRLKLHGLFGDQAPARINQNPYVVIEAIQSITPKAWRESLYKKGLAKNDRDDLGKWLQSWSARKCTEMCLESGSTLIEESALANAAAKAVSVAPERILQLIQGYRGQGMELVRIGDRRYWSPEQYVKMERGVAKEIQRLNSYPAQAPYVDWDKIDTELPYPLKPDQRRAAQKALSAPVTIITGGAGVGKTITLNALFRALKGTGRICGLTPTGKASQRLAEVTGLEIQTIHRQLASLRDEMLNVDYVVVDEGSIGSLDVWYDLLKCVPDGARVIIVGDINQLPSVSPGQVMRSLMASNMVVVARLTKVQRTALDSESSAIVTNAYKILAGEKAHDGPDYAAIRPRGSDQDIQERLLQHIVPEALAKHTTSVDGLQVITPVYGGPLGAKALNRLLQPIMNPSFTPENALHYDGAAFHPGDRVVQLENDYRRKVFNGDTGVITLVDPEKQIIRVRIWDDEYVYRAQHLRQLSHAFAMSVHKVQGSEYECAIMVGAKEMAPLLSRELYMTGITRAKNFAYDLLTEEAERLALSRSVSNERVAGLALYMREGLPMLMDIPQGYMSATPGRDEAGPAFEMIVPEKCEEILATRR